MAISWVNAGALLNFSSNVEYGKPYAAPVAFPATVAAGNIAILEVTSKPYYPGVSPSIVNTPAGWTVLGTAYGGGYGATEQASGTGNVGYTLFYKVLAGTEGGTTVTVDVDDINAGLARIYVFSNATGAWNISHIAGEIAADAGSTSVTSTFSSGFSPATGDHVIYGLTHAGPKVNSPDYSAESLTQTGTTFAASTEIDENKSVSYNGVGSLVCRTNVTAGGGTVAPTMAFTMYATASGLERGVTFAVLLNEATGGPTPVSTTAELRWDITQQIIGTSTLQWSTLQSLSSATTLQWGALQQIVGTSTLSWDLLQQIASDSTHQWDIQQAIASTLDVRWNIVQQIVSNAALQWDSLQQIVSAAELRWDIKQAILATLDARWNVESASSVISTSDLRWNIVQQIVTTSTLDWDVLQQIIAATDLRWDIKQQIASSSTLQWGVLKQLLSTSDLRWDIKKAVLAALNLQWDIETSLGSVVSTVNLRWDMLAAISASLDAQWSILESLSTATDLRWSILEAVAATLENRWDVKKLIIAGAQLEWAIIGKTDSTLTLRWNIDSLSVFPDLSGTITVSTEGNLIYTIH